MKESDKKTRQNKKLPSSKSARLFAIALVSVVISVVLLVFSTLAWFAAGDPFSRFPNRVAPTLDVEVQLYHFQRLAAIEAYGEAVLAPMHLRVHYNNIGSSFYRRPPVPPADDFRLPLWPGVSDFLMIVIQDKRDAESGGEMTSVGVRVALRGISWNNDLVLTLENGDIYRDYRELLSELLTVNVLSLDANNRFSTTGQIETSIYYQAEVEQHLLYDWDTYQGEIGSLVIIYQNFYLEPGETRQIFFYYSLCASARYPIMNYGEPLISVDRIVFTAIV